MVDKIKIYIISIIAILAVCSAVYFWWKIDHKVIIPQTNFVTAPENKKAKNVSKEKMKAEVPIEIFDKEEIAKQLKLQDPDKSNPKIQYTDAKTIPASERDTSVVAKWDTEQGKITIDAREEPLSLFGFENKREIGARVGYTTDGFKMKSTVYGRWDFLRVGNFHLGAYGEANSSGEGIAQIEVSYKF